MERVRVVTVDAAPMPGTTAFAEFGGAIINVYTTEESEAGALAIATQETLAAGWQARFIEDTFLLTRGDLAAAPEASQYFEQALLDGLVLVVHTYPSTPEEGDLVH